VPLFPGYVFCHFDSNKRLPILMTPGMVRIVGPGNRPEPVDDHEIASIRTIALSGRPRDAELFHPEKSPRSAAAHRCRRD
jgi:transcription antitermination factor NusG